VSDPLESVLLDKSNVILPQPRAKLFVTETPQTVLFLLSLNIIYITKRAEGLTLLLVDATTIAKVWHSTMMNAAATDADATNLNANTAFSDIKWDEGTQWNNVYCSTAKENFRAGESVELDPPIQITGTNYYAQVGAILRVDQQCDQQRVLLSLFLDVTPDMGIRHDPPDDQVYTQYPEKQVVWTRYQGWYPVTRVRREAYVVTPWEVSAGLNDTQITYGMSNAYCVVAKWQHEA
jgi:hypothetical protein